ncbi:peptide ABC transporter substrate-binding protein [Bradyrhizobium japonicum]|uniref:Peptide/nickel transport system substrate-binding protein n=1 Tax=Bradyrhizobium japonicum TaxID=375 RepID=A0ABV2RNZ9_BRAJP|nr:peptide ABC transporter substrate-binding protein [Bradyrhizobium japonicum]MBR0914694.1 peptide ABC transporter substrate-binding protein [Bradyrhizobium japonicum]MCD9106765.1 peptide ABC transporter substrate-binding protein [Bradyrhizobium japonicum]MCD9254104.1 peptide ABC transporter substrate-binding protein [Bradyrhizobium japonicum SEMIA 5079]MCD9817974.1 peptide ABC transporter substrate-binding protein [Bradyrhizobium japonicum]MCD9890996.1 peptide ABC transporter substrate-bindi
MNEDEIRKSIAEVKQGTLSRRSFIRTMAAAGIAAPVASQILLWNDVAMADSTLQYKPTKAGGGGPLKILLWQAPTLLNPHFAIGTKDQVASRIFFEPLAGWDKDGNLIPCLAAEIPTKANGSLAADGMSVIWKLKQGVKWHDGKPFTADDVVFTWAYAADLATAAYSTGSYKDITVEKIDDHTVKVLFKAPTPFWADPFVGSVGQILPKHHFGDYAGAKSREAPGNLKPVGTGPYKFVEFKPGDLIRAERNPDYHVKNQPHFDTLEVKGGGDAVSAARTVLQTGEYDYAWNLLVEEEVLKRMEASGKGRVDITPSGNVEFIILNTTDPWTEVDGERSSVKTKHPTLSDPVVRQAFNLLIDREAIQKFIYGRGGIATASFVNQPQQFKSGKLTYAFDVDKANKILDDAGWKRGADGIREKDGKKLKYVFQTSINAPRQKTQAIIKQACQKAGIDIELKSVTASVFFSSDVGNPDTYSKLYCDMEMYNTTQPQPDPERFLNQCVSWEIANKENKWLGRNISRWSDPEADKAYKTAQQELDPVKRAALLIKVNEIFCEANILVPLLSRNIVGAGVNSLMADISGWDVTTWNLGSWYRV